MEVTIGTRIDVGLRKELDYIINENRTDKSSVLRKLLNKAIKEELIEIAISKYKNKKISLERASRIAKLPVADFLSTIARRKIPFNYSMKSLEEDFNSVK